MAADQRLTIAIVCGCALATFVSTNATADTTVLPDLTLHLGVAGSVYEYNAAEMGSAWSNGNSTFGYAGTVTNSLNDAGFSLSWGLLVNPDPFIVGNLVVTNTSNATQTFFLDVSLPIGAALASTLVGGSVTGTVTDLTGDGATLSSVGAGDSIYEALTDVNPDFTGGNLAGQLLTGASASSGAFQSATIGPAEFGGPAIPSLAFGPVTTNIAIRLEFTLTAGDSASFTSLFVVVPAPAGALAFAAFGLVGAGRRRRN
jgi:hypothetical protein